MTEDFCYSVKRETGVNPVRTRHRDSRGRQKPLGNREGVKPLERSAGRPAFAQYGNESSGHEELAVRKKNLFACIKMVFPALMVKETSITVKRFWYP